jgi:endoglycosylceramidase
MDDETFLSHYDAYVDAAWARGIRVVVDFHQDVYAERLCGDGFPDWTIPDPKPAAKSDCPMWPLEYEQDADVIGAFDRFWASGSSVQAAYASMWDRMVQRYKDRPGVVGFEPINEPDSGSADSTTFEATTLTDFHTAMIARIHAAAPSSLVFFDPTGLAGTFAVTGLNRPVGDGIVFAPHFYAAVGNSQDAVTNGLMTWSTLGQSWNVPVFVGEFGASNTKSNVITLMNEHWNALDALSMNGTEWEYSVSTTSWNEESDTLVDAQGNEHPVAAVVIRPFARAIAGDGITSTFDPATSTYSLAFTPVSGTSEVSVPSRAYPNGFDLAITGACADATHDGTLLVSPAPSATSVTVTLTPKASM